MTREQRIDVLMTVKHISRERAERIVNMVDNADPTVPEPVFELTAEQEAVAVEAMGTSAPFGMILRVDEYPVFRSLYTVMRYTGKRIVATRRIVDQLDNVTVCWIK